MELFKYNGKQYGINEKEFPSVEIPGIGIRTAKEVSVDEEAQAKLIKIGSAVVVEIGAEQEHEEEHEHDQ